MKKWVGFRTPSGMIEMESERRAFRFLAFPDRPPHRRVRPCLVVIETSHGMGTIYFRAMREEIGEDALSILQDFLRANTEVGITSAFTGRPRDSIDKCFFLRSRLKGRRDPVSSRYRGGRRILAVRNPDKAFQLLSEAVSEKAEVSARHN